MFRVLLALAFLWPTVAHAKPPAKKKKPAEGEVWPPPDPATTGKDEPKKDEPPPPPKDPDPPKPDGDGDAYKLDPALVDPEPAQPRKTSGDDGDKPKKSSDDDDADDPCAEKFDDCKEDCAIAHSNDDTLHVKGKLPVAKCLSKCQKKYDLCSEQRENGFGDDKDRN